MAAVDCWFFIRVVFIFGSVLAVDPKHLLELHMTVGDVIVCKLKSIAGVIGANHWMLATSGNTVIHAVGVEDEKSKVESYIMEQTKLEAMELELFNENQCSNKGRNYKKDRLQAVRHARTYLHTDHWYSIFWCNCEHWVNKWTRDKGGYSSSSWCWSKRKCDAY